MREKRNAYRILGEARGKDVGRWIILRWIFER
jgi:hypothetical protein